MYDQKYQKSFKRIFHPLKNLLPSPCGDRCEQSARPSRYSLTTATGSKRSSADSDLLLCHVGLWRTSRFEFGCGSGCEHSEIRVILIVPSVQVSDPRPPTLLCGRADNACTNLLGFFVRYVRTRGIMRLRRERYCRLLLCHVPHALATHGSRD